VPRSGSNAGRAFPNGITLNGMVGPTSEGRFTVKPGRYHLACPWAYRSLIFRALKGLDKAISCQSCTGRGGVGGGRQDGRVVYARASLDV